MRSQLQIRTLPIVPFILAALLGLAIGAVVYVVDYQYLSAQQPAGAPPYSQGITTITPADAIKLAIPAGIAGFLITFVLALLFIPRK